MKQLNSKCSLCISTYNSPAALYHCLLSVKNQTLLPKEVIIADDGSTNETALIIDEIRKTFPIPIIHVWQKNKSVLKYLTIYLRKNANRQLKNIEMRNLMN